MHFFDYISTVIRNLFESFHFLGKFDLFRELNYYSKHRAFIQKQTFDHVVSHNPILYRNFQDEIIFLRDKTTLEMFPYPQQKKVSFTIQAFFDSTKKLPYVFHKEKKLFFPRHWSLDDCANCYRNYIERENLLGGGYTPKAPHQYQTEAFKIDSNDILLDVGCAEGLLALDSIELVQKVYLFEADKKWLQPLKETFKPYKDKVKIIPKFVSDKNTLKSIKLSSLFKKEVNKTFFVKMDIEGAEVTVLHGNKNFFLSNNQFKIACCTYHKQDDADHISNILESWNYKFEFSDGYMLYPCDIDFAPPYFRRGLIRASNQRV